MKNNGVMTTIQIKEYLVNKITKIQDKSKLASIKEYVEMECDTFHSNGAVVLTPEMVHLLEVSKQQYENGQYTLHEQVMAEIDIWLRERA